MPANAAIVKKSRVGSMPAATALVGLTGVLLAAVLAGLAVGTNPAAAQLSQASPSVVGQLDTDPLPAWFGVRAGRGPDLGDALGVLQTAGV